MNATAEPATACYHTHVDALTHPDGKVTKRPEEEEPVLVQAVDADTAARIAAWAFIETEMPERPVGWTLHVHVIGPRRDRRGRAECWTVDVYIDTPSQTLH